MSARTIEQDQHEQIEEVAALFATPRTVASVRGARPGWSVYRLHDCVTRAHRAGMLIEIEGHEHPELRIGDAFAPGCESARALLGLASDPSTCARDVPWRTP